MSGFDSPKVLAARYEDENPRPRISMAGVNHDQLDGHRSRKQKRLGGF